MAGGNIPAVRAPFDYRPALARLDALNVDPCLIPAEARPDHREQYEVAAGQHLGPQVGGLQRAFDDGRKRLGNSPPSRNTLQAGVPNCRGVYDVAGLTPAGAEDGRRVHNLDGRPPPNQHLPQSPAPGETDPLAVGGKKGISGGFAAGDGFGLYSIDRPDVEPALRPVQQHATVGRYCQAGKHSATHLMATRHGDHEARDVTSDLGAARQPLGDGQAHQTDSTCRNHPSQPRRFDRDARSRRRNRSCLRCW